MKVKLIEKPWGKEEWIEVNDRYVMKKITLLKGHKTSLQKHLKKHETNYFIEGHGKQIIDGEEKDIGPGMYVVIPPNTVHRMVATETLIFLEASTPELDDLIRIEDDYKRVKE